MMRDDDIRPHEFPETYQVTLYVKKVVDGVVEAEVWGSRTEGDFSRWEVDVTDERIKYGTLKIPGTAVDCLIHHLCFDHVEVTSVGNASAGLSKIFRQIRKRFRKT